MQTSPLKFGVALKPRFIYTHKEGQVPLAEQQQILKSMVQNADQQDMNADFYQLPDGQYIFVQDDQNRRDAAQAKGVPIIPPKGWRARLNPFNYHFGRTWKAFLLNPFQGFYKDGTQQVQEHADRARLTDILIDKDGSYYVIPPIQTGRR